MKYYNPNYDRYLQQYGYGGQVATGALSGAASGAAMGSVIGPWGTAAGAVIGGAVGGIKSYFGAKKEDEAQQDQIQQMQYQNKLMQAQQSFSNNNMQMTQFAGTNRFGDGGELNKLKPKPAKPMGLSTPEKNISVPSYRIPAMINSMLYGDAYQPLQGYSNAVDRNLTDTTQGFIKKNTGASNLGEAATIATINGSPREFYSTNETGITRLVPTTQIPLDKAMQAKKFVNDMYSRGQIKYQNGGQLQQYIGQDHATGAQGGIKVDQNGSPTATTGNQAVGLVEDGETSWKDPESGQTYIFSKKIIFNG